MMRKWKAVLIGIVGLWLSITFLETAAQDEWFGPVVRNNLEQNLDAGALFYTEIDRDEGAVE